MAETQNHAKINEAVKRIEAKGFTVEQVFKKESGSRIDPWGRNSFITVAKIHYIIEFSNEDGSVFGRVDANVEVRYFNKKNPYDKPPKNLKEDQVYFYAGDDTKKLLGWK